MSGEKTRWIFDDEDDLKETGSKFSDNKTGEFTGNNLGWEETQKNFSTDDETSNDDSTRWIDTKNIDHTVIFSGANSDASDLVVDTFSETVDPVVGWLVVLRGPGKGNSVPLGHGMNLIGRNPDQRVPINFGDNMISGKDHAKIIYEDRQFYISHGSGANITKVNGKMVPNMVPLSNYALIQLTKATTLAFIALCGADFDWSDVS